MRCSNCNYRKSIPLFTKCAGIAGRTRAGTSYYCSHPEIDNPVPVIPVNARILEDCPFSRDMQDLDAQTKTVTWTD